MSHNKGSALLKPPFPTKRLDSRVLRGYCGAQVIYGPGPFTCGESKGPSRGGLWFKPDNTKHKIVLGYSWGQFSPRQNPKSHRKEGQKRYRTKLGKKSKISRESCPYCHSILCTWRSRILRLLQPPPTTLGIGWWDKYQSWGGWPYTWTKDNERRLV